VTLLVANFGSGMGAQLGAARLLYGMGRSKALPASFFGVVDPKRHVPRNNVVFVGLIALAGALLVSVGIFSYGLGAEMLNFGALIAFMGVNMAAFIRYFVREKKRTFGNCVPPLAGFLICLLLWLNLSTPAKIVGAIWMGVGILFGAIKTKGFRGNLINFELPPEES
jgi:amino acid transporter